MSQMNPDIDRFNSLFAKHKAPFVRFAENYVRDHTVAENLVVDAFLYYWEHRAEIRTDENLSAYLLTVVKHKCLNHIRHEKLAASVTGRMREYLQWDQQTRIASLEALDPRQLFLEEMQEIVRRTLESLPEQTRRIFEMSRRHHLSNREIAAECGLSVKGVEFHITRALKAMRVALKDYYPLLALLFIDF